MNQTNSTANDSAAQRRRIYERYLTFDTLVQFAPVMPIWAPDGSTFWYAEGAPAGTVIYEVDPAANTKRPFLDAGRLRAALERELGHAPPYLGVPFDRFTPLPDGRIRFSLEGIEFTLHPATYELSRLPRPDPYEIMYGTSAEARFTPRTFERQMYGNRFPHLEALSPDRTAFLTLLDHNLWLRSSMDGTLTQLTVDGTEDVDWDFEAARPLGGTAASIPSPWSPDGLTIFATRVDRRRVVKEPRVHFLKTNTEVEWSHSDKPGTPMSHFEPYLVPSLGGPPVRIDLGDTRDQYFLFLGWRPDGSEALYLRCSRDFRRVDVMAAETATGRARIILTEEGPTFVRVQHDILFFHRPGFTALPDGSGFVWQSERDGWNHLYLYDFEGNLIRRLTEGAFPVLDVQAIDQEAGYLYFTAHTEPRLYDTHLYRVPLSGGAVEQLTEAEGQHRIQFSPSKQCFLDTHSSADRPPRVELRSADGRFLQTLRTADISRLEALGWTPPEEFVVKAADGETDLWGVLFKPYDFDPTKRYPVIEHIYGGPQTTYAPRDFTISPLPSQNYPRALAQLGYIVVMLDARGTPERSKAFHDTVYGNWGRQEIPDHAAAIRQLGRERPYMDLNRTGVFGHSWGGYFAFKALIQAPNLYRAAVVSGPALDAMSILSEPYLGLLEANKAAYDYASLYPLAPRVRGNLLLIAGTNEHPMLAAVMRMTHALIEAGIHHELIILPEQHHGYAGKSMIYVLDATTRFFDQHLH